MASGIWERTTQIVRKETRCHHMGYSFRLAARVLLYAPSHRQDNTYHGLCYTSCGALAWTRNSSMAHDRLSNIPTCFRLHPVWFSFQPVLHDWCNKGRGMCYPVCEMVHIKEHLLLIGKYNPCDDSGFPLSLSEWSFTIYPTPYNRK